MVICVGVHSKRVHMFTDAFKAASRLMNLFFLFFVNKSTRKHMTHVCKRVFEC